MTKAIILLVGFVFILSCNCQKPVKNDALESTKISSFLGGRSFDVLQNAEMVVIFDIKRKALEGTDNEFSNTLVVRDTLGTEERVNLLSKLQNDSYYNWDMVKQEIPHKSNMQFLVKTKTDRFSIMFDSRRNVLAFISLEGQKVMFISPELGMFLSNLK